MYICKECGNLFVEPHISKNHSECRGFTVYEKSYSSPCCFADYVLAKRCHICGEYITGEYVEYYDDNRLGHVFICENCYTIHDACEDEE